MKNLLSLLCFSISLSAFADSKKLVVLGDSLTEGYGVARESAFPALLEKKLKAAGKDWTVINAGISGSTTASAPSRLKWVLRSKPDFILLSLGANDGLRGVRVAESKKNLAAAIEIAQKEKIKIMLAGLYLPPNYGADYSKEFRQMFEALAKQYQIPFMPFLLEGVGGIPKYNQADGIHPNEKGHEIIAENVEKALKGQL